MIRILSIGLVLFFCFASTLSLAFNDTQKPVEIPTGNETPVSSYGNPILIASNSPSQLDQELWDMVKTSEDIRDFEDYLKEFPDGFYKKIAKFRIRQLKRSDSQTTQSEPKPQQAAETKEIVESFNVVRDESTGLMWQKREAEEKVWWLADRYCADLELDGYDDWKLPNKRDLVTSFNIKDRFPGYVSSTKSYYWSSSTNNYDSDYAYGMFAENGELFDDGDKTLAYLVRCVRITDAVNKRNAGRFKKAARFLDHRSYNRTTSKEIEQGKKAISYYKNLLAGKGIELTKFYVSTDAGEGLDYDPDITKKTWIKESAFSGFQTNDAFIFSKGKQLGLDVVITYDVKWRKNRGTYQVYLFDIESDRKYSRTKKTYSSDSGDNWEEVMTEILNDYINDSGHI
ncbi:DUF1566 domain-containing protein [bacterium]|nr:DUF1566 domain-containing protein [bacterium]